MNCLWAILVLWTLIELWPVKHVAVFLGYPVTVRYMSSFILNSNWACIVGHLDKKISNCLDHSLSYFITFTMSHHWAVLMHWMQSYSLSNMFRFFFGDTRYIIFECGFSRFTVWESRPNSGNLVSISFALFQIKIKFCPTSGEFDHHFLPRGRELDKKIARVAGISSLKKFSQGMPRGCTQLELTET